MPDRYMMATDAHHVLGDLSRPTPSLALVRNETDTDYVGEWVTGFGYINVRFPKATTRALTPEEVEEYREKWVSTAGRESVPLVWEGRNAPRMWEPADG